MNDRVPDRFRPRRPPPRPVELRFDWQLPSDRYVTERTPKSLIVIHHTAGATARSSFESWERDPRRVGAHFLVGRDGTVYQVMPTDGWIYALGLTRHRREMESRAIHVEIADWGWLRPGEDGRLRSWAGTVYDGDVLEHTWRGERYWEPYTAAAVEAAVGLIESVTRMLGIPRRCPRPDRELEFDLDSVLELEGIAGHSHVRADKTDPHPGFADGWNWLRSLPGYEGDW